MITVDGKKIDIKDLYINPLWNKSEFMDILRSTSVLENGGEIYIDKVPDKILLTIQAISNGIKLLSYPIQPIIKEGYNIFVIDASIKTDKNGNRYLDKNLYEKNLKSYQGTIEALSYELLSNPVYVNSLTTVAKFKAFYETNSKGKSSGNSVTTSKLKRDVLLKDVKK